MALLHVPAASLRERASRASSRMPPGVGLLIGALVSIGLWAAIVAAVRAILS